MVLVGVFAIRIPRWFGVILGWDFFVDILHYLSGHMVVILTDSGDGHDHCKSLENQLHYTHGNLDYEGGLGVVKSAFPMVVDNHLAAVYHIHPFGNLSQDEIHSDHVLCLVLDDHHVRRFHLCRSLESVFSAMLRRPLERCGCSFGASISLNLNGCQ